MPTQPNVPVGETYETVEEYSAPVVAELGPASTVTLGKYAEDSQDQDRYFE